jgi:hypothetical protein
MSHIFRFTVFFFISIFLSSRSPAQTELSIPLTAFPNKSQIENQSGREGDSAPSLQAGGWSSGGGTGIACWQDPQDALAAREARTRQRPLPKNLYARIKTLFVTDYWEYRTEKFSRPLPSENSVAYMNRIFDLFFGTASPSFKLSFEQALARVQLSNETDLPEDSQGLLPIEDTGPIQGFKSEGSDGFCAVVQIASRHSRTSSAGNLEAKVYLDHELYNKLGLKDGVLSLETQIINQSILRTHEALYLLGYSLDQKTSEKTRVMSSFLFLQESYELLTRILNKTYAIAPDQSELSGLQKYAIVMILYHHGFGEFPYIGHKSIPPLKKEFRDAYRRYQTGFATLNQSIDQMHLPEAGTTALKNHAFAVWMSQMTGVDAFIGAALSLLLSNQVQDFYVLLNPQFETQNEIRSTCSMIDRWLDRYGKPRSQTAQLTVEMFRNAKSYCKTNF